MHNVKTGENVVERPVFKLIKLEAFVKSGEVSEDIVAVPDL
jgi:hypothetical protein